MNRLLSVILVSFQSLLFSSPTIAQDSLEATLAERLITQEQADSQITKYLISRIKPLRLGASYDDSSSTADQIRQDVLENVVFQGVPTEWRDHQVQVEDDSTIKTEHGYSIRKIRYEALPGLWIPALIYTPYQLQGKVPVVINVNGHERIGKSVEYKQKRCINQAKRGMIAINLEWIGMGQLNTVAFSHNELAKLDVCGVSGLAVFYLSMSKAIDVALSLEHADPDRLAVTGLSGGGWQTIIISSLDTRVKLAVPVAGHSALGQRIANRSSIGDLEQNPNDLGAFADYVHLNTLMVPRPLLLIYNTKDNCCFVASTVKANTYEPVIPFYAQANVPERLHYHENSDPGDHNYQLDNRQQLYAFLETHFFPERNLSAKEIDCDAEIFTNEDLIVPLPNANENFHTLATNAVKSIESQPSQYDSPVNALAKLLRLPKYTMSADLFTGAKQVGELSVRRLRLLSDDGLILPCVIVEPKDPINTVTFISDKGFMAEHDRISKLASLGVRVVAIDPVFIGQSRHTGSLYSMPMLAATLGQRPLGIQTAQVTSAVEFILRTLVLDHTDLESHGPRSGVLALTAAATSEHIVEVSTVGALSSVDELLSPTASYSKTPEAYCFGLLRWFKSPQVSEVLSSPVVNLKKHLK